jgi:hypothetical protein
MPTMPTVTQVLKDQRLIDARWFTESARDAGTELHLALQLLDEDDLDIEHLEERRPDLLPRVRAYQAFLREARPEIREIERRVEHPTLGYSGGPDRVAIVWGSYFVLDIKRGAPLPWHGIQLAAYAVALQAEGRVPASCRRANIYPKVNGYVFQEHTSTADWQVFLSALNVWKWRRVHASVPVDRHTERGSYRGPGHAAAAGGGRLPDR